MKRILALTVFALALIVPAAFPEPGAPSGASAPKIQEAVPALAKAAKAPVIDGLLDDEAWATGLKFDGFKTFKPDYGKEASQRTEAYIAYDADNFYFAFRCYDDPDKVKGAVCKRDTIFQDDVAFIILDPFNDLQSGFSFIVNPCGIQGDGMVNVQGNLELSFDAVWYSAGRVDDQGWTAEARIPFKSLRFPNRKVMTWRVLFVRFFTRTSEQVAFPPLDPANSSLMQQAQPFEVSGIKYKRVAELLPAFTFGRTQEATVASQGQLVRNKELDIDDFSLTGKLGLTSELTVDGTYNPDFSQIEADAGQIDFNRRYSLYYEEKRPFFLERNDLWQFGGTVEEGPLQSIVYTRTIVDPDFGFRLTGKVTSRDTVAAIYARDNIPGPPAEPSGEPVRLHPDFIITRYKHSLNEDSYIGGFYTAREADGSYNRVGGIDGRFRLSPLDTVSFHLFGSLTKAPGAESADDGHALAVDYSFGNRKWIFDLGYQDISENFQVDTGFFYRTGLRRLSAFAMYSIYPKSKFFQKIEPFYWSYHLFDTIYERWETVNLFTLRFRLPRNTMFRIDTLLANEVFGGQLFNDSGFGFQGETQIAKSLYFQLFARRTGNIFYDPAAPYQGYGTRAMAYLQYQPITQLDFNLSLSYVDFYRKADKVKIYDYLILRSRNTFQINKYLFIRGIVEYNDFYKRMTLDGLVSFTYIPGTVVHLGYGSALEKAEWDQGLPGFAPSSRFREMKRGFFFKVSYLHRF
ncbi:MAG TPA: carbohydrate binding family 9 domain-containing protein [Acidobacteriota bacterium]|nr:carbohydrate binding family 9 domain-containing protein [Acidobacteriota bacterium]